MALSWFNLSWLGGSARTSPALPSLPSSTPTSGIRFETRNPARPVTVADIAKLYDRSPSFTDYLPWLEFDNQANVMCLADGHTVGVVFELNPVSTEAKPDDWLRKLHHQIQEVISTAIPEQDQPWVLQLYAKDETRLDRLADELGHYAIASAKDTMFSQNWRHTMAEHLTEVSRPGGLFLDETVTGNPFQGKRRMVRGTLYRPWLPGLLRDDRRLSPVEEVNEVFASLASGLEAVGVGVKRYQGKDVYDWLVRWFNPKPEMTDGDTEAFANLAPYPDPQDEAWQAMPFGWDFSEQLLSTPPVADKDNGLWWLDGLPHKAVFLQNMISPPAIGALTHEMQKQDSKLFALFDRLPEHTILAMTITILPQDTMRSHLLELEKAAFGDYAEARLAAEDARLAQIAVARGNKLFSLQLAFLLRGEDKADLRRKTNLVNTSMRGNKLNPILEAHDLSPLDGYLRCLPMAFDPHFDKRNLKRSRLAFAGQIAALSPLYGRTTGTGHPGLLFFNRGGEPMLFDPLSKKDRKKNSHLLLVGPTGSGKSATLVYMILSMIAVYRPRIYLIEAGNSFGLLGEYLKAQGLSVHAININPGSDVSLPPFADALKLLQEEKLDFDLNHARDLDDDPQNDYDTDPAPASPNDGAEAEEDDEGRDILGEMEIAARIMITGGEEREEMRMSRADRQMIRKAIYDAAVAVKAAGRPQVLTEDVQRALEAQAKTASSAALCDRAAEMSNALGLYCSPGSFDAQLFNRVGKSWPDQDVTLVELGLLAREGYQDKLTVTYISLMNAINSRVEKEQYDQRPTLVITDEGHIITTNPLLAPYVIKITKMWRKFGAWFWIATQNLQDFPDASRRMLSMLEWWLCLVMPKDEIEQIARFRQLTAEQEALLLAARKSPGQFTEGVVMSDQIPAALFRNVPPALALALGMTEKDEKAKRAELMQRHQCTELEAVYRMAEEISRQRGAI